MLQQYFNITKIMDDVYHINEPFVNSSTICCTLIVGKEKALLFDTCNGIGNLKQTIKSITDLPVIVVNSHGHIDHVGGNYEFDKIYIHRKDIEIKNKYAIPFVKNFVIEFFKQQNFDFPKDFSQEEYVNIIDISTLIPVEEGFIFDLGEKELEVVHMPGHTNGSVALLDKKNRILFSGDSISSHVLMYLEESTSIHTYIKSLEKINKLDFDNVIASHFIKPYTKNIIDKLIHCANNIDVSKSTIYANPAAPIEGLMYAEGGEPFVDPDFVSIVYTKDKLL